MNKKFYILVLFLSFLVFLNITTYTAAAEIIYSVDADGTTDNTHFRTIQSAIEAAVISKQTDTLNTYAIEVEPGTYSESISIKSGISSIRGRETARTFLTSTGPAIVTADNVTGAVTFRHFTLINGNIGINVNNASIEIENNVFQLGANNGVVAIQVQNTGGTRIINNTFHQNHTAISAVPDVMIKDNIFSQFTNAILPANKTATSITFNAFTADPGAPVTVNANNNTVVPDPLFVDSGKRDFHLKQGSLCITGSSTGKEMGAYGGTNADTIPYPVSILSSAATSSNAVSLSWTTNEAHNIGSYTVYYNLLSGATTTESVAATSLVVTNLTTTVPAPSAPVLNSLQYADRMLILSWSLVPSATGYRVHALDSSNLIENTVDVGDRNFYVLTGLVNGRDYGISVSAYSQAKYRFRVTAVDDSAEIKTPGISHESDYSPDANVALGPVVEGLRSSPTQTAYPDRVHTNPDLPDTGCFIATAAYGYYSAPQVQVLRDFRDRYLLTNAPGRGFVKWYYRHGPVGAAYINEHPWLKPVIRLVLLPFVGSAYVMVKMTLPARIAVLLVFTVAFTSVIRMRKSFTNGGAK